MDQIRQKLKGDTGRLAGTYLAIIMGLTLVFSGVIFSVSSSQFDRPLPRGPIGQALRTMQDDSLQDLFEQRANEARAELFLSLLFLNLAVLLGGAVFSYFLARKTLEPIEAAMEAQAQFVSDASHELRTPLTALQVTNEVALRKKKFTLPQAKELIGHNLSETIKLRAISESLLGLARQDAMSTDVSNVTISQTLLAVIETLQPMAKEKSMTIKHNASTAVIKANEPAIMQITQVLLDNAIKYGPESSTITVSFADAANEHQVAVHDDGAGIPTKHQSQLFKRFYRVDESRSSQNVEGTGLGLSIAKAAADRQGYRISLQAGEKEGNTFILHIPKR